MNMKRISQILLFGAPILILLAAACAPVGQGTALAQGDLTNSPTAFATDTTATNTTLTPSIPVTGAEIIRLDCQYCVDNIAHAQLVIPREAKIKVISPPELASGNDDDDDDDDNGEGGRRLTTELSGAAEVPPADPDGSGTATLRLRPEKGEACFELTASNIGPATAAHIHEGAEGVAGPVVVPLDPAPTGGSSSGCVSNIDTALLQNIIQNPEQYYVNVHNEEFPDGAIRGQLVRANNNGNDDDDGDDDDDGEGNRDRLGCRVIDRFRDTKLVLCRAEENTTITLNVCMEDNNCTEVQLTLQSCAGTATPTPFATNTATPTVPVTISATVTGTSTTPTPNTSTPTTFTPTFVAPPTGTATATPTVVTNTPIPPSASSTPTPTSTSTSTPTP